MGRITAKGAKIEGTDGAIKREMEEVVRIITSDQGEAMRETCDGSEGNGSDGYAGREELEECAQHGAQLTE